MECTVCKDNKIYEEMEYQFPMLEEDNILDHIFVGGNYSKIYLKSAERIGMESSLELFGNPSEIRYLLLQ
jgi:hypothetical protein